MEKIKIAFDLDGVIIDKPPLIPKKLIEWLFRGDGKKCLHYRFPHSKLEQKIRKISHFYLLRPPIKKNIEFIRKLAIDKKYEVYVVSARYSFLAKETKILLDRYQITSLCQKIYTNLNDEQPHLFKEKILKELKAQVFVDDDSGIVEYLEKRLKNIKLFFYRKGKTLPLGELFSRLEI